MISQEVLAMDLAGHSLFSCWKSNCPFPVSSLRKVSKKNTTNCDFCGVLAFFSSCVCGRHWTRRSPEVSSSFSRSVILFLSLNHLCQLGNKPPWASSCQLGQDCGIMFQFQLERQRFTLFGTSDCEHCKTGVRSIAEACGVSFLVQKMFCLSGDKKKKKQLKRILILGVKAAYFHMLLMLGQGKVYLPFLF